MSAQPQDHKLKKATTFSFIDGGGKTHQLPLASKGREKMSGRDLRDAALGGEMAQVTYLFRVMEASAPSKTALDALYEMPQGKMMDIIKAWGEFGDGDGASLGK